MREISVHLEYVIVISFERPSESSYICLAKTSLLLSVQDEDARIRLLALERIGESGASDLFNFRKRIRSLVMDPDTEVQAVAKKIMNSF